MAVLFDPEDDYVRSVLERAKLGGKITLSDLDSIFDKAKRSISTGDIADTIDALGGMGIDIDIDTALPSLKIEWNECGGPVVEKPTREGYGSGVITDLLTYEFGGRVGIVFATGGLRCAIELPVNADTVL